MEQESTVSVLVGSFVHWYFYTPPHDSGLVLWFHVGYPCVCLYKRQVHWEVSVCIGVWFIPTLWGEKLCCGVDN